MGLLGSLGLLGWKVWFLGFVGSRLEFSIDIHGFPSISTDFHRFLWIFIYFEVWMLKLLKIRPAAPIETFARFQAGFLSSEDF